MKLNELSPAEGSKKAPKRIGRGHGSGQGKTAGKGHKGQKARSGKGMRVGFEGGQLPLFRRVPKHGFTNYGRVEYTILTLSDLEGFENGATVTLTSLVFAGLIRNLNKPVKIVGTGELTKKLEVKVQGFTKSAKAAIEKAGGKAEVVSLKDARVEFHKSLNDLAEKATEEDK